jgi:hypothetical protein
MKLISFLAQKQEGLDRLHLAYTPQSKGARHICKSLQLFLRSFLGLAQSIAPVMKEPIPKPALAVRCPTCGAAPGEGCKLTTGLSRTAPHRDRRLIAKDRGDSRRARVEQPSSPKAPGSGFRRGS